MRFLALFLLGAAALVVSTRFDAHLRAAAAVAGWYGGGTLEAATMCEPTLMDLRAPEVMTTEDTGALSLEFTFDGFGRRIEFGSNGAITVAPDSTLPSCGTWGEISAPEFRISGDLDFSVDVPRNDTVSVGWVLEPRSVGTHTVLVAYGMRTESVGISVTNAWGLTLAQARILSLFAKFLGPLLTLPGLWKVWRYLWDRSARRRRRRIGYE